MRTYKTKRLPKRHPRAPSPNLNLSKGRLPGRLKSQDPNLQKGHLQGRLKSLEPNLVKAHLPGRVKDRAPSLRRERRTGRLRSRDLERSQQLQTKLSARRMRRSRTILILKVLLSGSFFLSIQALVSAFCFKDGKARSLLLYFIKIAQGRGRTWDLLVFIKSLLTTAPKITRLPCSHDIFF